MKLNDIKAFVNGNEKNIKMFIHLCFKIIKVYDHDKYTIRLIF